MERICASCEWYLSGHTMLDQCCATCIDMKNWRASKSPDTITIPRERLRVVITSGVFYGMNLVDPSSCVDAISAINYADRILAELEDGNG